jgi:hypothetical protein
MKKGIAALCGICLLAGISHAQAATVDLQHTPVNLSRILTTSQNDSSTLNNQHLLEQALWVQSPHHQSGYAPVWLAQPIAAAVPEPATYALIILCLIGLIVIRRRRLSFK